MISLDTGLRLDGLPALELWDPTVSVFGNVSRISDRSVQPDKTSRSMVQQVRPHYGDTLLDGDAQSVRYGGMLRDRSGQLDNSNSQERGRFHKFHHGK